MEEIEWNSRDGRERKRKSDASSIFTDQYCWDRNKAAREIFFKDGIDAMWHMFEVKCPVMPI